MLQTKMLQTKIDVTDKEDETKTRGTKIDVTDKCQHRKKEV